MARTADVPSLAGPSLARFVANGLLLITSPLIARSLGAVSRGEFSALIAYYSAIGIVTAWGTNAIIRNSASNNSELHLNFNRLRGWVLVAAVPTVGFARVILSLLLPDQAAEKVWCFSLLALSGSVSALWIGGMAVVQARRQYKLLSLLIISPIFVYAVGVIALSAFGLASLMTLTLAQTASIVGASFFANHAVRIPFTASSFSSIAHLLKLSSPFALAAVAEVVLYRADQILSVTIIGAQQAGIYAVASFFAFGFLVLSQGISAGVHHALIEKVSIRVLLQAVALISMTGLLLGSIIVPYALPIIFGGEFEEAIHPAIICLLAGTALPVSLTLSTYFAFSEAGSTLLKCQLTGGVVGLGLMVPLGVAGGAVGLAWACAIGYWSVSMMMLAQVKAPVRTANLREIAFLSFQLLFGKPGQS